MKNDISTLNFNKVYSYANYLTWRFEEKLELIKGRLFKMSPAPSMQHQRVVSKLLVEIGSYLKHKKCQIFTAPFDVRLPLNGERKDEDVYTVVQPDICIICDLSKLENRGCLGAPDMIIEILSPSNANTDVKDKFEVYRQTGVREYWIAHPLEGLINVFILDENGKYQLDKIYTKEDKLSLHILPDCEIDLTEVFEDITT